MSKLVILDAEPVGLLCAPPNKSATSQCATWLAYLLVNDIRVILPEIADYEVRRELLRAEKAASVSRLDMLATICEYLPISTAAMRRAAELWAFARQSGQPTAGDKTIDADMILIAQSLSFGVPEVVIATSNIGHLSRFISAKLWPEITA